MSKQIKIFSPVIITLPHITKNEASALRDLIKSGAEIIHIRKPENTPSQIEDLLRELSEICSMKHFTLHVSGHGSAANSEPNLAALAAKYGCGGIHFRIGDIGEIRNEINSELGEGVGSRILAQMRKSISTHSFEDISAAYQTEDKIDYLFLSPIFDSISKSGYRAGFDLSELKQNLAEFQNPDAPIIAALGGVDKNNIRSLHGIGFSAAALLGAVWIEKNGEIDIAATVRNFQEAKRAWLMGFSKLQLISDGDLSVAREFLEGGGRWIQIRMKNTPPEEIVARGREMLELCKQYSAVMVVNDNPLLVPQIGAHGVHLGRSDMAPDQARKLLGDSAIIGVTANTFEHIADSSACDIDYIGLGPFRYTTTKSNLSPILGTDGYGRILSQMQANGIDLPIIAIGGITPEDIAQMRAVGLENFAVSGAISHARNVTAQTELFIRSIDNYRY